MPSKGTIFNLFAIVMFLLSQSLLQLVLMNVGDCYHQSTCIGPPCIETNSFLVSRDSVRYKLPCWYLNQYSLQPGQIKKELHDALSIITF